MRQWWPARFPLQIVYKKICHITQPPLQYSVLTILDWSHNVFSFSTSLRHSTLLSSHMLLGDLGRLQTAKHTSNAEETMWERKRGQGGENDETMWEKKKETADYTFSLVAENIYPMFGFWRAHVNYIYSQNKNSICCFHMISCWHEALKPVL